MLAREMFLFMKEKFQASLMWMRFVLAIPYLFWVSTYSALENDGHDTLYTDYWADALQLDKKAKLRLEFYRLFYIIVFMRKHSMTTANSQKVIFNVQRLKNMFDQSLMRILE